MPEEKGAAGNGGRAAEDCADGGGAGANVPVLRVFVSRGTQGTLSGMCSADGNRRFGSAEICGSGGGCDGLQWERCWWWSGWRDTW